jgi:hypothetical protein
LRVGIARGMSYASVLIIPRRKTSSCEAPHGRRPWPDLKLHGSSPERGRRRERRGGAGGAARGGVMGLQPLFRGCCLVPLAVREEAGRRKEKRRKEREKKKKRKGKKRKYGKNFKLENF